MIKIAILSFYSGIVERGVETFAYEVANRLSHQYSVTMFQAGNPKPFQKYASYQIKAAAKSPTSQKGALGKLYLDLQSLKILIFSLKSISKIKKGKFKVVFVLNGGWQTVILRIVSKILGLKMIVPGGAGIGSDDAWNLLFKPDVFVALTNAQSTWAHKLEHEVQVEIIPNGVDLSRFNPKSPQANLPLKKPIVICTAALVPYKRVEQTIKAVAKTKLSLLLLGDGELRGVIDSLGKRLLGERYLRLVIPYEEIPTYYKACKIFTLASKTEAFGTAYIEALACNLPVVTTSDETRAEIIGDAGILTDPQNTAQYARDLQMAAKIDYKNKPYNQSLKFSWNKVVDKYSLLINNLVKGNTN